MSEPTESVPTGATAAVTAEPREGRRDLAQFILVGLLVVVGAAVIIDASRVTAGMRSVDPVGPKAFPMAIGIGCLLLAAALSVAILRGSVGEEEGGEDVDLTAPADWLTVAKLAAILLLNIALVDFLGWAITGGLLFAGCAWVLGSRTPVRDLAIGFVLSVGSFYAFYVGLGVPVPAGILDGIL